MEVNATAFLRNRQGQALVEWSVGSVVLLLFLVGEAHVLKLQWQRTRCAILVFELTHQARARGRDSLSVRDGLTFDDRGVRGRRTCAGVTEKVDLPWLETAQW